MSALESQWIMVFRADDYGAKGSYTQSDLDQIVADSRPNEIPAVVGHPKADHSSPAYAWVKALKREGNNLYAQFDQIDPSFEAALEAGRYKKRSIALQRSKGKLSVRHIGFLGAAPPEVKGMPDIKFGSDEFETIDFSEEEGMAELEQKLTFGEWLSKLMGRESKEFSAASTQTVDVKSAVDAALAEVKAEFAQQMTVATQATEAVRTEFAEYRKSAESTSSNERVNALITGLKAAGRWIPAYSALGVPQMFSVLASSPIQMIEFGEGDAKRSLDAVQLFADILNSIGQIVPSGELVKLGGQASSLKPAEFNTSPGLELDMSSVAFNEAVETRMKEKNITFGAAMLQLRSEGWKTSAASATIGAV